MATPCSHHDVIPRKLTPYLPNNPPLPFKLLFFPHSQHTPHSNQLIVPTLNPVSPTPQNHTHHTRSTCSAHSSSARRASSAPRPSYASPPSKPSGTRRRQSTRRSLELRSRASKRVVRILHFDFSPIPTVTVLESSTPVHSCF